MSAITLHPSEAPGNVTFVHIDGRHSGWIRRVGPGYWIATDRNGYRVGRARTKYAAAAMIREAAA